MESFSLSLSRKHLYAFFSMLCRTIRNSIREEIGATRSLYPRFMPHLAIVQVGTRHDSSAYVKMKQKAAEEAGIKLTLSCLPESVTQIDVFNDRHHMRKPDQDFSYFNAFLS
eukprot:Partr_v1_DN28675_c1_g1_i2_m49746